MNHSHKDRSIRRLTNALDEIPSLKQLPRFSPEYEKWHRDTEVAISNAFEDKLAYVEDFKGIRYSPVMSVMGGPQSQYDEPYIAGLNSAASMLESMIGEIKEYWDDDDVPTDAATDFVSSEISREVFLVHGKDDGAKETVARYLEQLGLEPIVLHEQPNQGRTIIEKFEQYAQVGFAVVLLTPDDEFSPPEQGGSIRFRARQNVILELGFFLGILGREKTLALHKGKLELPSDYDGVLYIPLDEGEGWKLQLVQELLAAGLEFDASLAFRRQNAKRVSEKC